MYNWSTDTKELKKDKEAYIVWQLSQTINFGLTGKKIKKSELKKYWMQLKIDPAKKKYLKWLLWG
jgi:hypothetical protein